jgi:hypothetical protein
MCQNAVFWQSLTEKRSFVISEDKIKRLADKIVPSCKIYSREDGTYILSLMGDSGHSFPAAAATQSVGIIKYTRAVCCGR